MTPKKPDKTFIERRARIVCTLGPASESPEMVSSFVREGMDVARLNFSHGDHSSHLEVLRRVREVSGKTGRAVAVLQDLQGIKIRTGPLAGGEPIELRPGERLLLKPGLKTGGREGGVYVSYPRLLEDARVGDRILIDDGLLVLAVRKKLSDALETEVAEGGMLRERKGVNLPGMTLKAEAFTRKDRADLTFGLDIGVDAVAVSFVREAREIRKVRGFLKRKGRGGLPLIAKIEKPEALDNLEEILGEADGIMVARGDLGVEVPQEDVPLLQKHLIERAAARGRFVITATQMLESMTANWRPTRAEVTDVANAVLDGSDALMLSAETSAGRFPLESLRMMDRIIRRTEADRGLDCFYEAGGSYSEAVAEAAVVAALQTGARHIVAFTTSGLTARLLSSQRPPMPIVAFTPSDEVRRSLALSWGITPLIMRNIKNTDELFKEVERRLRKEKLARAGDTVVITAGTPLEAAGNTNLLKIHRLG